MAIIVLIVNKLNNNESSSLSFVKQYLPTFCKRHIFAYSDRLLLRNIHHVRKIAIYQNPQQAFCQLQMSVRLEILNYLRAICTEFACHIPSNDNFPI